MIREIVLRILRPGRSSSVVGNWLSSYRLQIQRSFHHHELAFNHPTWKPYLWWDPARRKPACVPWGQRWATDCISRRLVPSLVTRSRGNRGRKHRTPDARCRLRSVRCPRTVYEYWDTTNSNQFLNKNREMVTTSKVWIFCLLFSFRYHQCGQLGYFWGWSDTKFCHLDTKQAPYLGLGI